MIKIVDIESSFLAANIHELETALMRRNEKGVNVFWISHEDQEYPKLSVLVNEELAVIHYLPREDDAGYRSMDIMNNLD